MTQIRYEVRYTCKTYPPDWASPRLKQWRIPFDHLELAQDHRDIVKITMESSLEEQERWTEYHLGEDGTIESVDGIWEIQITEKRIET